MYYPMRALTQSEKPYIFYLEDGPCPLDQKLFILSNQPGSPLLLRNTVQRGCIYKGIHIFEGDILKDTESKYKVLYCRGFKLISKQGRVKKLNQLSKFSVCHHIYTRQEDIKRQKKSILSFRVDDSIFYLKDILACSEENIYIYDRLSNKVKTYPLSQVCQNTGVVSPNGEAQFFKKGAIELIDGEIREGNFL